MADIAGVGSFGFQPVRSNPEIFRTQGVDVSAREQDTSLSVRSTEDAARARGVDSFGFDPAEESGESSSSVFRQQTNQEDQVTLSTRAQEVAAADQQAQDVAAPPNLLDQIDQAQATQQVPSQIAGVDNNTNQQVAEESTSATLNGNQDGRQSEQNRALGQLVDQFA